jgi:Tol biopolymer transport system component
MRRVLRWGRGLSLIALLLAATAAGVAGAAAPDGPRLALVKLSKPLRLELLTVDPNGAVPVRLAGGGARPGPLPFFSSPLSWSPDGGRVAFSAIGRRKRQDRPSLRIFLASADGASLRRVPGTANGYWPVFSPDGLTIAFTRSRQRETVTSVNGKPRERRFEGAAIWTVDLATGTQRQLTPWRNGLAYFASSFSPDGSTLLTTRQDDRRSDDPEPVALGLTGGRPRRLLIDGGLPVYSPDGSKIALVRETSGDNTDLYVIDAIGAGVRRLTRTPERAELFPSWDPSGQRLAYMRLSRGDFEGATEGIGSAVMQINADGTCPTKVLSAPRTGFYVPAWQPGLGREAGRIAC